MFFQIKIYILYSEVFSFNPSVLHIYMERERERERERAWFLPWLQSSPIFQDSIKESHYIFLLVKHIICDGKVKFLPFSSHHIDLE